MARLTIKRGVQDKQIINDGISGLAVFMTAVPSAFSSEPIHKLTNIFDAERLGIVGNYSDEVKPSDAVFSVSGTPTAGDFIKVLVNNALLSEVYAKSDSTLTSLLTELVDKINDTNYIHGFSASLDGSDVTITPRSGLGGITINLTVETSSNLTSNLTNDFGSGTVSPTKLIHYLINRYFTYSDRPLYLGVFQYGQFSDELVQMQNFANGEINQFGVLVMPEQFSSSLISVFQVQAEKLFENKTPAVITLSANFNGINFDSLPSLNIENGSNYVNVFLGNNGNYFLPAWDKDKVYAYGDTVTFLNGVYQAKFETSNSPLSGDWNYLFDNPFAGLSNMLFSEITTPLALLSIAPVHENIGWVGKYDVSDTVLTRANVLDKSFETISEATITSLENKNYTFFRYYPAQEGIFISDTWTAISKNNDYATLENNRVFNKAVRITASKLNPFLNSPIYVNPDGTVKEETIEFIKSEIEEGLNTMLIAREISNFKVYIDPKQDVLATGLLKINIAIQPVGVARYIEATLTFVTKLK